MSVTHCVGAHLSCRRPVDRTRQRWLWWTDTGTAATVATAATAAIAATAGQVLQQLQALQVLQVLEVRQGLRRYCK